MFQLRHRVRYWMPSDTTLELSRNMTIRSSSSSGRNEANALGDIHCTALGGIQYYPLSPPTVNLVPVANRGISETGSNHVPSSELSRIDHYLLIVRSITTSMDRPHIRLLNGYAGTHARMHRINIHRTRTAHGVLDGSLRRISTREATIIRDGRVGSLTPQRSQRNGHEEFSDASGTRARNRKFGLHRF